MTTLDRQSPPLVCLKPGCTYQARAGLPDQFARESQALWAFLNQASMAPMGLELCLPATDGVAALAAMLDDQTTQTGETCRESFLTIFTSGTTGQPKACKHPLPTLLRREASGANQTPRWLLTFAPFRWAGVSVMLHVWRTHATLVVPASLNPLDALAAARSEQATHVSLTPSMFRKWQLVCPASELGNLKFQQVTFGGEVASQSVLDRATQLWPTARISHVYATSETGDLCSVSDGLAGIPESKFRHESFHVNEAGELEIAGHATGDLWELREGRYYFQGRAAEIINVGGAKVSPQTVEEAVCSLPGVDAARAFAIPSPLVGQLVGLEYCGSADVKSIRLHVRSCLPKPAWPAEIHQVTDIKLTDAGKTARRNVQHAPSDQGEAD